MTKHNMDTLEYDFQLLDNLDFITKTCNNHNEM